MGSLHEWALAAFSGLIAILASLVLIRAGRRDRHLDEREATKKRIDRHAVEIRHTQKEANISPFYDGDL